MINNRDCFFYKKSDFINRLQDISPDSVCYIADTQQIYTHGRYFECNVTQDVVEQLIQNHGYLTAADLPVLTGGASPTPGEYVTGVSVGGHNINVQKGKLSEINVGTASKLETPRKIELSGDLSGSIMFDGSQDVNIETIVHNSTTADRLTTPRTISLSSQATGQVSFDGSGNVNIPVTVNELDSKNSNNQDLNSLVTLNGYGGSLFYGIGGNTSINKPSGVDWFGLFSFKSASGNYTTQILGSNNRLYSRSNADTSLGSWNTIAYLTDNVASATKLKNTRTFTISDGTNSGTASNFDGTGNVTLRLPGTINANIVGDITGDISGDVTGDLYGNADTATKLQTGRNINGTLFDGTRNITTAQWGTARNLAIGNSTKSVNGSTNVSWTLSEIGAVNKAGDTMTGTLHVQAGVNLLETDGGSCHLHGIFATNDWWDIAGYTTAADSGYLDIRTGDGGNEPIYISQIGSSGNVAHRATILDGSGNTQFPGTVTAPTFSGALSGNASSASKLATARTITLTGDASGSANFDGSANISIPVTIANDSHTHATSASSNATINLTITAGGTTATVADLYATYADQLRTARTISLTGDVTGSTSFNGTGNVSINATVANDSHEHNWIHASYNGSGGDVPPNYIGTQKLMCKMMSTNPESTDAGNGYCDWILMNAYTWSDVPYATAIGVKKASSASDLYAYIMSGPNSDDQTTWNRKELVTTDKLTWSNISDKPSSFTPSSHTHTISQISDLNASWDSLLKSDPKAYVTRWPSISEVTDKQNLVIRLNGGTTEGTNQFTYNGTAAKTLSITPNSIGAAASKHTHNMNEISDASSQYVTAGTVTRKVFLCKNKTGNGWISRVALGLTNPTGKFSPAILSIGTNDGGTSWYDYTFTPDGHITNSRGEFALVSQIPSLSGYATQSWVQSQGYLTSVTWDNVKNKPSWIGSSKPSYAWSEITGKPSTFIPSSHSHAWLNGWADTRSVVETPNSYNGRFEVVGIKNSSTYGISSGTYVQVLGFRGWTDSSGGRAHELAFADNGRIYHRDGATTSWDSWDTVAYLSDIQKNTTGTSNSTSKLYLVGGTTQNSAGIITYSNSAVYTQSGQLYATQMNSTNGFFETSDAKLKDFKEDVKALDTVDQIPTKYFTWKEDENQELQIGTSAQEVEKLYPELVSKTEDDTLTVDYAKLSIIALAAIKELNAEIQSLKEEIKQLKSK